MSDINWDLAPEGAVELKVDVSNNLYWVNDKNVYWDAGGCRWANCSHHRNLKTIATRLQPEEVIRFKVGDKVKRVRGVHLGMGVGDCATVARVIHKGETVALKEYRGTHSTEMLELVPERKTVEDAVKWANCVWPERDCDAIAYNPTSESFGYYESRIGLNEKWYHVCNQSEFEACVAAKSAEVEPHFKATRENLEKIAKDAKGEPEWTHIYLEEKAYIKVSEPDCDGYILVVTEGGGYNLARPDELKPIKPTITKADEDALVEFMKSSHKLDVINEVRAYINEHDITN
ncbi:MAG: hypothetical protein WA981_03810 [Glaciecola sp.]